AMATMYGMSVSRACRICIKLLLYEESTPWLHPLSWVFACTILASNAPGELRPTGTEPRTTTKPALWAVSSAGWVFSRLYTSAPTLTYADKCEQTSRPSSLRLRPCLLHCLLLCMGHGDVLY